MGGCSSNTAAPSRSHEPEITRARRRLSVTPKHVDSNEKLYTQHAVPEGLSPLPRHDVPFARVAITKKGYVPHNPTKQNQDSYFIDDALGGDSNISLYGVCDGHGDVGHQVSSFVARRLPVYLSQEEEVSNEPIKAIEKSVQRVVYELSKSSINATFSGTTLTFCMRVNNTFYATNIGDSRCVIGRQAKDSHEVEPIVLTRDHKPDIPEEKHRILKAGGRVATLPGPLTEDCGPLRVWLAEIDAPGLAMSRSIGDDISHSVGVISTPEIEVHEISENDLFCVLATDGVFEFISNEELVDIVVESLDNLNKVANNIALESIRRWRDEEEVIDDITAVIIDLRTIDN